MDIIIAIIIGVIIGGMAGIAFVTFYIIKEDEDDDI